MFATKCGRSGWALGRLSSSAARILSCAATWDGYCACHVTCHGAGRSAAEGASHRTANSTANSTAYNGPNKKELSEKEESKIPELLV
jgi:hypothetical protein